MRNPYDYTWYDLDLLVDNDPVKLRDLAFTYLHDLSDVRRVLFQLLQEIEKGRAGMATPMSKAREILENKPEKNTH